jgi:hypothetical protein
VVRTGASWKPGHYRTLLTPDALDSDGFHGTELGLVFTDPTFSSLPDFSCLDGFNIVFLDVAGGRHNPSCVVNLDRIAQLRGLRIVDAAYCSSRPWS